MVEWTAAEAPSFQMILEGLEEAYDEAMIDQGASSEKEWIIRKRKKDAMVLIYNQVRKLSFLYFVFFDFLIFCNFYFSVLGSD